VKTLTVMARRFGTQERGELERLIAADAYPRVLLFHDGLSDGAADASYGASRALGRAGLSRFLPEGLAIAIAAYLARSRYDAIVSWEDRAALLLALLMKATGARTPHVAIFNWLSSPRKGMLLRLVQSHIDRVLVYNSRQRAIAVDSLGIAPDRVTYIDYFVDQQFWRPLAAAEDTVYSLGNEMRDYATLIEAMRGLDIPCRISARPGRAKGKRLTTLGTILAGGRLPANVSVGTPRSYVEGRDLYARARFVVIPLLPTDVDHGGTAIMESMAMGKAVITSRVAGQVDFVVDGETGLYVAPQDPAALREAIQFLWSHPEVAARMGQAGRKRIEERYTLEQFVVRVPVPIAS
jgi:glycosyltransferase involved in cell wall biosynthesis